MFLADTGVDCPTAVDVIIDAGVNECAAVFTPIGFEVVRLVLAPFRERSRCAVTAVKDSW